MRMMIVTTAVCAAALAGCSDKTAVTASNSSVEAVQKQVEESGEAAKARMNPGRWEGTVKMAITGVPGAPTDPRVTPVKICVKPEDIKPGENPFSALAKNCKYDRFTMADGKIDSASTCDLQGMKIVATTKGDFSPDAYKFDSTSQVTGAGPMGSMKTDMSMDLRRTGECKGDETRPGAPAPGAAAPAGG